MLFVWIAVSCVVGVGIGLTLGRSAWLVAAVVLALSFTPMAVLFAADWLGLLPNDSNLGILAVLALVILAPGAIAIFAVSWFRD